MRSHVFAPDENIAVRVDMAGSAGLVVVVVLLVGMEDLVVTVVVQVLQVNQELDLIVVQVEQSIMMVNYQPLGVLPSGATGGKIESCTTGGYWNTQDFHHALILDKDNLFWQMVRLTIALQQLKEDTRCSRC